MSAPNSPKTKRGARNIFLWCCRAERGSGGTIHSTSGFCWKKVPSIGGQADFVQETQPSRDRLSRLIRVVFITPRKRTIRICRQIKRPQIHIVITRNSGQKRCSVVKERRKV